VAEALQIVYSVNLDPICAELAHHLEIAGKLFKAADFYVQAFKVSQRLYSNQKVIFYSEKARSLYCQLSQAAESEDVRRAMLYAQVEVLCQRDWTWRLMGRMADIQNDVQTLTKLNQQLCDNSLAAQIARLEASLHYRFCRLSEACDASQQGIELSQKIGDRRNEALCTLILGRTLRAQGRYDDGLKMLRTASALFQEINDLIEQVHCMSYISTLHWMESDYLAALQMAEETLAYCEQVGLTPQRRFALGDMGAAAVGLGDLTRAESWLMDSLAMAREFDDRTQETFCLGHLGWLKFRQGEISQALKLFQDAYALATKCELLHYQSWLLSGLCFASAQKREITQARAYGESALYMAQRCGLPFAISLAKQSLNHLEALAQV
jgi:tetratricopeptide (TPR) repeat protein